MTPEQFPGVNTTYAKNQPPYLPLPVRKLQDGTVTSFWKFSPAELERIRDELVSETGEPFSLENRNVGVYVTQLTFNKPLQPLLVTLEPPPPCFESVPAAEVPAVKVDVFKAKPDGSKLADIAHMRGLSAPILFAMDSESIAGKCIVHFLRLDTQVFDDNEDFGKTEFNALHKDSDERLTHLAACFTDPQQAAVIDLYKALSLAMGNLALILKMRGLPPSIAKSINNALLVCQTVTDTHNAKD